jgi:hypothetical protein
MISSLYVMTMLLNVSQQVKYLAIIVQRVSCDLQLVYRESVQPIKYCLLYTSVSQEREI